MGSPMRILFTYVYKNTNTLLEIKKSVRSSD